MSVSMQNLASQYTTLGPSLSFEVGIEGTKLHVLKAIDETCNFSAHYQALSIIIMSTSHSTERIHSPPQPLICCCFLAFSLPGERSDYYGLYSKVVAIEMNIKPNIYYPALADLHTLSKYFLMSNQNSSETDITNSTHSYTIHALAPQYSSTVLSQ